MKYLRTKDGLWEYVGKRELALTPKSKLVDYYVNHRLHCFVSYGYGRLKEERIIEQADTIKELCDEFVFIGQDRIPLLLDLKECFDRIEDLGLSKYTIYGAIWTDKGLIYIAKMNEKGELELLWAKV